ncbi:induced myeloid leukemia cell differentiation protein Mcl-1 homolog [Genypterus blacodes]|uniref:induced myeloid leukemia cell differentiation protein Mcl-1 homolog n=1 Tax=Genypterus blacodes TaxID=154954 RepID=UPI003F774423
MSLLTAAFLLPQNGVVQGRCREPIGYGTEKLELNVSAVSTKNYREDSGEGDGQSEPGSGGPSAECDLLENVTRRLVGRFLTDLSGLSEPGWNESKALSTMKRVAESLLEKHRYTFNGMVDKLSLDDRGEDMSFISSVARSVFEDGTPANWGRVVSLLALAAAVCWCLKERGRSHCVELVGREVSTYLLTNQREWLLKNNSWDGFVEFFQVRDPESMVWQTLMAFTAVAGFGATLAWLIR